MEHSEWWGQGAAGQRKTGWPGGMGGRGEAPPFKIRLEQCCWWMQIHYAELAGEKQTVFGDIK